jgi:hypothetical protein
MTFEEFMSQMLKPTFVWQMASGVNTRDPEDQRPLVRSARTRLTRVRRRIDDLVLQRANTIADERRCAAVSPETQGFGPSLTIRCELQREHGRVQGRRQLTGLGLTMHDKEWDHAAPSKGLWWMEPEEAHA